MMRPEDAVTIQLDINELTSDGWTSVDQSTGVPLLDGLIKSFVTLTKAKEELATMYDVPKIELDTYNLDPTVGPGAKYHAMRVKLPGVIVYFSYGVVVGFRALGQSGPVLARYRPDGTSWSRTTSRHLNMLDGGGTAKKARVEYAVMVRVLNSLLSGQTATVDDAVSPVASRVSQMQDELDLQEGVKP